MTTIVCLFHHRKSASNLQRIFNLLRKNVIKAKCDLTAIGKRSLCVCKLSPDEMLITDEEFHRKQKDFEKLKIHQWFEQINRIIELKIMNICDSKISLYKLRKLICEISNEKHLSKVIKTVQKNRKTKKPVRHTNSIRRQIELTFSSDQIGHLLGREGRLHKRTMRNTGTRIHFDNLPYSISSSTYQATDFDLDLFQSSSPVKITISGDTSEAIEEAIEALQDLEKAAKV